jgi:hypothetical protein
MTGSDPERQDVKAPLPWSQTCEVAENGPSVARTTDTCTTPSAHIYVSGPTLFNRLRRTLER